MITNGREITEFNRIIKYPQVLVYSKEGRKILFEIPNDIDIKYDLEFKALRGSVVGWESQDVQFFNFEYERIRFPYGNELRDYEHNKSI